MIYKANQHLPEHLPKSAVVEFFALETHCPVMHFTIVLFSLMWVELSLRMDWMIALAGLRIMPEMIFS